MRTSPAADGVLTDGTVAAGVLTEGAVADGVLTEGAVADGVAAEGVVAEGTVPAGVDTRGVVTEGTVIEGVVGVGVVTIGVVTDGVVATGVLTGGTVTDGTVADGTVTLGTDRFGAAPPAARCGNVAATPVNGCAASTPSPAAAIPTTTLRRFPMARPLTWSREARTPIANQQNLSIALHSSPVVGPGIRGVQGPPAARGRRPAAAAQSGRRVGSGCRAPDRAGGARAVIRSR